MKKTNIKKVLLALALATAVVGPAVDKAYATDSVEIDLEYIKIYNELKLALKKAKEEKASYKYLNGSYVSQKGLDAAISDAEELLGKINSSTGIQKTRIAILNATTNLNEAMARLDGNKASIKELKELLDDNRAFTESSSFIYATKAEKDAYVKAYEEANSFVIYYGYDESKLSEAKVAALVKNLKDARMAITKAYEPLENKLALKEEIALASKLRNDGDKYTKKSFDTFLAALKLAETSVEDKAKMKTAAEYKEITETLKSARLALVKNEEIDKDKQRQIKRLEEAKQKNKTSVEAARLLLDIAPEKVKDVKGQLLKLIKESEDLVKMADKLINDLKGIKG